MSRTIWFIGAGALILGVIVGGAGVETYHHTASAHLRELFNQKLRCNGLGKKYADLKSSSAGPISSIYVLERVDYSESRNSCVAEITNNVSVLGRPDLETWNVQIVDVGTQEIMTIYPCPKGSDCVSMLNLAKPEFEKIVGQ